MTYRNQTGRTMMEMLGVLAIMGIIIYGAISGINYGMTSYRVNQLYIEIGNIINGIQDMYLTVYGRNNFPNLNCDNTGENPSVGCNGLIKNGIMTKTTKGIQINIASNKLTVTLTTPSSNDLCDRLKEMDWDIQSVNCTDVDGKRCKDSGSNCCDNHKLYFSPK